jgi:hypothetical protein
MVNERKYSVDWFSHNIPIWNEVFTKNNIIGKDNLRFLEIGCFEGLATNYMLDNILTHETSKIDIIDTFLGSVSEAGMSGHTHNDTGFKELYNIFMSNTLDHKAKLNIHIGQSNDILRTFPNTPTFDCIYIDGSHKAFNVLEDAVLCNSLLKTKGILIFDDYEWKDSNNPEPYNSPKIAIDSFIYNFAPFYGLINKGYQIIVQKL